MHQLQKTGDKYFLKKVISLFLHIILLQDIENKFFLIFLIAKNLLAEEQHNFKTVQKTKKLFSVIYQVFSAMKVVKTVIYKLRN